MSPDEDICARFVLVFLTVCPIEIKSACQSWELASLIWEKFYQTFQPLTWCFVSQTKENLSISFNYIRVTSVSHIPIYPNFLSRKIVKSISIMENETEEAIKMQKLKKTNCSPFGNRTCLLHWCLIAWLMKTKLRKWDFPRQTNVNGNSWCNNVLLARLLKRNHQNRKKT